MIFVTNEAIEIDTENSWYSLVDICPTIHPFDFHGPPQQLFCTVRKADPSDQVANSSDFKLADGLQRVCKIYKCTLNTAQCRTEFSNHISFSFCNLYRKDCSKCSNKVLLVWLGKCLSYWSVRHPDRSSRTCTISQQYLKGKVFIADGGRKTAKGNSLQRDLTYAVDSFPCVTTEVPDSKESGS